MQLSESIHTILSYEGVDEQRISTITRFILSYLDETQRRGFVISRSEKMEFNHNLRKLLIEIRIETAHKDRDEDRPQDPSSIDQMKIAIRDDADQDKAQHRQGHSHQRILFLVVAEMISHE